MSTSSGMAMRGVVMSAVFLISLLRAAAPVFADDAPTLPLSQDDRKTLDQYLGSNVVGEPLPAPRLQHGLSDLIVIGNEIGWRMRITCGKARGAEQRGSAIQLQRPDGATGLRVDLGDGRNVLFGQLDAGGNLYCYASQDNREGVLSRFSPAEPIVLADVAPGETRRFTSHIEVSDLSRPDVESHSGQLNIEYRYIGAFRLALPAGSIDALCFKSHLTGKVGPADVDDTVFRFFAKDHGPVAIVEINEVSAFLIYHEDTRVGKVLIDTQASH